MTIRVRLEFNVMKEANDHLLLNVKNIGSGILKNMVVQMHSPDPRSLVDRTGHFIYSLMPEGDMNVEFRILGSLIRVYFSVIGYMSGDTFFSAQSRAMTIRTEDSLEYDLLLA